MYFPNYQFYIQNTYVVAIIQKISSIMQLNTIYNDFNKTFDNLYLTKKIVIPLSFIFDL